MSEKPQEKPLQGPQPKPGGAGWKTAAIGILIAIVIGLIMIAIGSAKIKRGAQMQKEAELRLGDVVQYLAADAKAEADQMDEYLRQSNWGLATKRMGKLTEAVSLLDQIAPEAERSQVEQVKDASAQAQEAIDSHADDWRDKLDNLRAALDPLTGGS
jgi:hypothetical protein